MRSTFLVLLSLVAAKGFLQAGPLEQVSVSRDGRGFILQSSGQDFVPWGVNYDHDRQGRLIEDYWHAEWATVAEDFREIKSLGANVVRIHLQLARFMDAPDRTIPAALAQLKKLLLLAEETGLYLDLTGLGCYHKQDVPDWYDALDESSRWEVQARFWTAVSNCCAASPAVFCYDLMNEPIVPGGNEPQENWLGPSFAGKHFVQFITRDRRHRPRAEIAKTWMDRMIAAIRQQDPHHLITVGLVDWSLDRPGLTSGFIPDQVCQNLDFVSVHLYPESGRIQDALKTLRGFQIGKPVLIEETFPLKCSLEEELQFIRESRPDASGWISFYWGQTPAELQSAGTLPEAMLRDWLIRFQAAGPNSARE